MEVTGAVTYPGIVAATIVEEVENGPQPYSFLALYLKEYEFPGVSPVTVKV